VNVVEATQKTWMDTWYNFFDWIHEFNSEMGGLFVRFVEIKRVTLFLQHVDLSTLKFIHFKTIPSLRNTRI
jgi:hypothetical protein